MCCMDFAAGLIGYQRKYIALIYNGKAYFRKAY